MMQVLAQPRTFAKLFAYSHFFYVVALSTRTSRCVTESGFQS